jgi:hypothetical protein
MSEVSFEESGMEFGPFPGGRCFRIERSETFRRLGDGVRMAEFLLLRKRGIPHAACSINSTFTAS